MPPPPAEGAAGREGRPPCWDWADWPYDRLRLTDTNLPGCDIGGCGCGGRGAHETLAAARCTGGRAKVDAPALAWGLCEGWMGRDGAEVVVAHRRGGGDGGGVMGFGDGGVGVGSVRRRGGREMQRRCARRHES